MRAVIDVLYVTLHSSMIRSDEDIAIAATSRLAWQFSIPRDAIKSEVEKGWAMLSG